jgi:3-dehydroquinate synthase
LHLIEKSVAVKAAIVERDPEEQGVRKALNFGHTVGHAIESAAIAGGMEMYHGEAVAYGMVAELYLSVRKMGFDRQRYEAIRRFIQATYLPYVPVAGAEELYGLMLHDKKNEREGVNFSLLRAPGLFEVNCYCSREEILEALKEISHASDNS